VGCILAPLRGCDLAVVFGHAVEILVLTHSLEALGHQNQSFATVAS
jgi:hypothetical protein